MPLVLMLYLGVPLSNWKFANFSYRSTFIRFNLWKLTYQKRISVEQFFLIERKIKYSFCRILNYSKTSHYILYIICTCKNGNCIHIIVNITIDTFTVQTNILNPKQYEILLMLDFFSLYLLIPFYFTRRLYYRLYSVHKDEGIYIDI